MHGENGVPETPDWWAEPRPCPFNCTLCDTATTAVLAQSITLGEN